MEPEPYLDSQTPVFPCFLCGECCRRYQVRVSLSEARNISEKLGVEWEEFLDFYTDSRWPGETSFLLCHRNGACIFLKQAIGEPTATCSIHNFKPESCIQWTAGPFRRECQDGLKRYWQLTVGEDGTVNGDQEKIVRFENFVSSLDGALPDTQE